MKLTLADYRAIYSGDRVYFERLLSGMLSLEDARKIRDMLRYKPYRLCEKLRKEMEVSGG